MRGQKGFRGKTQVGRCFNHTQTMLRDAFQSCLFSLISLFTLKTDQNEQGLVTEHNKNKYMLMTPTKFSDDPCNRSFVFASINMYQARSSTIKFVFCILQCSTSVNKQAGQSSSPALFLAASKQRGTPAPGESSSSLVKELQTDQNMQSLQVFQLMQA